jgi:hypothetical protein
MGWFNRKKDNLASVRKAGTEAAELTMYELNLPFLLSRFHESDGVKFPQGFFKDPYIYGFCSSSFVFFGDYFTAKRKEKMNETEKQEFILSASAQLYGDKAADIISSGRLIRGQNGCSTGEKAGRALMISISLPSAFTQAVDQTEPFVVEALEIAQEREQFVADGSLLFSDQKVGVKSSALILALRSVTVEAYIKKTFLS